MPRKRFSKGLPKPPKGMAWHYNSQTREWKVMSLKHLPPQHSVLMDATLMMQGIDNLKYAEEVVTEEKPPVARPNKYDPEKKYQHVVLHGDTFQGICLRYGVTPTQLRRANNLIGGTNLKLAPSILTIPVDPEAVVDRPRDESEWIVPKENLIRAVMRGLDDDELYGTTILSPMEAKCYLEIHDWDVDKAVAEAREDAKFEAECLPENHHEFGPSEAVQ